MISYKIYLYHPPSILKQPNTAHIKNLKKNQNKVLWYYLRMKRCKDAEDLKQEYDVKSCGNGL